MRWRLLLLAGLLLLSIGISLLIGVKQAVSPRQALLVLFNPGHEELALESSIIWELRMSRVVLAVLVGAALGAAGAGYQGLFRNPLADPFVIGASSGAALGAALSIMGYLPGLYWGTFGTSMAALLGALSAVGLVYVVASVGRSSPTVSLLLAGVAVSSFIGAVVSLLMFVNNDQLLSIFGWMMGSFAGKMWSNVATAWPLITVGCLWIWLLSRPLDTLSLGEEAASSLGLNMNWTRGVIVFAASLTTAAAVAAGGIIGFVGLVGPHFARFFVGARHVFLIPASCLVGAILLVLADIAARSLLQPTEVPAAIITAILGSPFFLIMLRTHQHRLGGAK